MKKFLLTIFGLIALTGCTQQEPQLSAFGDPFISLQVGTTPANNDVLVSDGTNSNWSDSVVHANATTTRLGVESYLEMLDTQTAETPAANRANLRVLDTDADNIIDAIRLTTSDGTEIDLTGGGGGCTTLPCDSDVSDTLAYTSGHYFRADGSQFTNSALLASDLSGSVAIANAGTNITTYTLGDILYASAANVLGKLGIGTTGQVLKVSGGIPSWSSDVMDLTSDQTVSTGIKSFTQPPRSAQDATTTDSLVNFGQLTGLGTSQIYKDPVTAATTTSLTLSGLQDVDIGVTGGSGDRVLMAGQSSNPTNGCYTQAVGAWTRCTDYDAAAKVLRGTTFPVEGGTFNAGKIFIMNSPSVTTLGVDTITFSSLVPSTYTAGDGLDLTGTQFSLDLTASRPLYINATELDFRFGHGLALDDLFQLKPATSTVDVWRFNTLQFYNASNTRATTTDRLVLGGTNPTNNYAPLFVTGNIFATGNATSMSSFYTGQLFVGTESGCASFTSGKLTGTGAACGTGSGGSGSTATTSVEMIVFGRPAANSTTRTWTNMPAAETEIFGATDLRVRFDSTYAIYYRVKLEQTVAGFAGADFNLECSTDNVSFVNADLTSAAGEVDVGTGTGLKSGSFTQLSSTCKGDVYWRIVGKQGNATVDPRFSQVIVEFQFPTGAGGSSGGTNDWQVSSGDLTPTTTIGLLFPANATTTATSSAQGFKAFNLLSCDTIDTDAEGHFKCGTDSEGAGGASSNWTFPSGFSSSVITPSTTVGLFVNASSTFSGGFRIDGNATTTNNLVVGNDSATGEGKIKFAENMFMAKDTSEGYLVVSNDSTLANKLFTIDTSGNATTSGWLNIGTTNVGATMSAGDLYVGDDATITDQFVLSGIDSATGGTNDALCIAANGLVLRDTTDTCVPSSRRFKHAIFALTTVGLAEVLKLNPSSFIRNGETITRYGFIAEEVAKVNKHLATYGVDGKPRGLDDHALIAVMVNSVKEMYHNFEMLFSWTESQDKEIEFLKSELCKKDNSYEFCL